jgi:transcription antitermination factor NusA-like protein
VHFLREDTDKPEQPLPKQEISVEFKKTIEAEGDFTRVALDPRVPDKTMCIGAKMSPEEQVTLLQFLDKNIDVFVWSTSNLIGVSREVIDHKL